MINIFKKCTILIFLFIFSCVGVDKTIDKDEILNLKEDNAKKCCENIVKISYSKK